MSRLRIRCLKTLDRTLGVWGCRGMHLLLAFRKPRDASPTVEPRRVRRILVIRPGGLGDMILLLPVLHALRHMFPGADMCIACERRNGAVLPMLPWPVVPLIYDRYPWRVLLFLLAGGFDLALDTEQFHHASALLAYLSRAPMRVGFNINPVRNALYTHRVPYPLHGPEAEAFGALLEPLCACGTRKEIGESWPPLTVNDSPHVRTCLNTCREATGFVALHPGSQHRYKTWRAERFVEVARRLREEWGWNALLVGGRAERNMATVILREAHRRGVPIGSAVGLKELGETAAILQRARLFVGTDSGLAHLAGALGTPSVVLFGPSDAAKWGWKGPKHAIVRKSLPCAPCFMFGRHRPCATRACMEAIGVEDVLEACRRVVTESEAPIPERRVCAKGERLITHAKG